MSKKPFIERCLAGEALNEEIDDDIDQYHDNYKGEKKLLEYLGFTRDEYKLWVEQPDTLPFIIAARKRNVKISQVFQERMAARGVSQDEETLLKWLKDRNYVV